MSKEVDILLADWARNVTRSARKLATGTEMSRDFRVSSVRNGIVNFETPEYGLFQNAGVRGSVRTITKVGKSQREAINLGISDRKYKYTDKRPPAGAFKALAGNISSSGGGGLAFAIRNTIFENGFPATKANLNWLNKPFRDANKAFDEEIADGIEDIFTLKIYGEED